MLGLVGVAGVDCLVFVVVVGRDQWLKPLLQMCSFWGSPHPSGDNAQQEQSAPPGRGERVPGLCWSGQEHHRYAGTRQLLQGAHHQELSVLQALALDGWLEHWKVGQGLEVIGQWRWCL